MLIYAGIDEAGYGPMLGPLCVACTVFVLKDHDADDGQPNLWALLKSGVCRKSRDSKRRIAVDDSKRLKGANSATKTHPLAHLERGVLAFVRQSTDELPATDEDLCRHLGVDIAGAPWYGSTTPLPVAQRADMLRIAASRLHRCLERAGIECALMACEAIDAECFNRDVARTGSKACVNLEAAMRLIDRVRRRWPDEHPRVVIDRHGGRTHYREELQLAFPDASISVLAESPAVSRYRLEGMASAAGSLTVSFAPESEDRHFPTALASMTAKYVRELHMARLNRFFTARVPELKPTAGYVQDARRFVEEIEPVIDALGVARQTLIRSV
jgi:ribonuclease HII